MRTTEEIYNEIMASDIFRLGGPRIDLPQALIDLAAAINAEEETDWDIGAYIGEPPLSELVVGAYWALTEWHAGQASDTYAALCALGTIYKPNMEGPPGDEDGSAFDAYQMIGEHFESQTAKP